MSLSSSDNHRSFSLPKQPFLFILKTKPGQHILFIHHITQTVLQTHTEVCERDGWILAGNIKGKSFLRAFFWWQLVTFDHDYGDDYGIIWSRGAYYDTVLCSLFQRTICHWNYYFFTMFNITCHIIPMYANIWFAHYHDCTIRNQKTQIYIKCIHLTIMMLLRFAEVNIIFTNGVITMNNIDCNRRQSCYLWQLYAHIYAV